MPNGIGLAGDYSSTNSGLIVPVPGNPNRYYIFTTDESGYNSGSSSGLSYSMVDLCLNGGYGDVVEATKNTLLFPKASEPLAAVKHANGIDYWLVSRELNYNRFHAYRVTREGLSSTPVITRIGSYLGVEDAAAQMKISPDGTKLAQAASIGAFVEVFNFDASTGTLSDFVRIPPQFVPPILVPMEPYGLEFSPDGTKLYVSGDFGQLILQYDLSLPTQELIVNSKKYIYTDNERETSVLGMQLGPNGKLYAAVNHITGPRLAVINKPNIAGWECDFEPNVMQWLMSRDTLSRTRGMVGLPGFVSSYFDIKPTINVLFDCIKPKVSLSLNLKEYEPDDIMEVTWIFFNPSTLEKHEANGLAVIQNFETAGYQEITATIKLANGKAISARELVQVPTEILSTLIQGLGPDVSICPGGSANLDASSFGTDIQWSTGSRDPVITVENPGRYYVVACRDGCLARDTIDVFSDYFTNFLGPDTTLCETDRFSIDLSGLGDTYQWQDGNTSPSFEITRPGYYSVEIIRNGCSSKDTLGVEFCDERIEVPNVFTPNGDGKNDTFEIRGIELGTWSLVVFDRYGQKIYSEKSYLNDWDAVGKSSGIYYYSITQHTTGKSKHGWVHVIK